MTGLARSSLSVDPKISNFGYGLNSVDLTYFNTIPTLARNLLSLRVKYHINSAVGLDIT